MKYKKLGKKLGYTIPFNSCGYGLVLCHYGTIVVGFNCHLGNYPVLFTSTCITALNSIFGDAFYLSTGAVVAKHVEIGDNVKVAANSVVLKSHPGNALLAGIPAIEKKEAQPWYVTDGEPFTSRQKAIEILKQKMNI